MRRFAAVILLLSSIVACEDKASTDRTLPAPVLATAAASASATGAGPKATATVAASSSAPSAPAATPIDGALPKAGLVVPSRKIMCDAKSACDFSKAAPAGALPADARAPVTLFAAELGKGATVSFPLYEAAAIAAVVLEGKVDAQPLDASKDTKSLAVWQGFFAPRGFVRVTANDGPARVVFVAGTRERDVKRDGIAAELAQGRAQGNAKRPGVVTFFDLDAREDLAWGGGAYHARIGWEVGDEKSPFIIDALRFGKDAGVAKHVDDTQWEVLAVLEGEGKLVIEREPGKPADEAMTPGSIAFVPPNTPHAYVPSGAGPFLGLQVYAPPGPEQRFRKLAGK